MLVMHFQSFVLIAPQFKNSQPATFCHISLKVGLVVFFAIFWLLLFMESRPAHMLLSLLVLRLKTLLQLFSIILTGHPPVVDCARKSENKLPVCSLSAGITWTASYFL